MHMCSMTSIVRPGTTSAARDLTDRVRGDIADETSAVHVTNATIRHETTIAPTCGSSRGGSLEATVCHHLVIIAAPLVRYATAPTTPPTVTYVTPGGK